MASEPGLATQLQALFVGLNGVQASAEDYLKGLQYEVRRRELDLVRIYLQKNPTVVVPPALELELQQLSGMAWRREGEEEAERSRRRG